MALRDYFSGLPWLRPRTVGTATLLRGGRQVISADDRPSEAHPRVHPLTEGNEFGASGTENFGGYIRREDYNPELDNFVTAVRIYDKMRLGDAQIRAMLSVIKLPLRGATWVCLPPEGGDSVDQQIADFCNHAIFEDDAMETSWDFVLRHILLQLDYGFSVLEKVWRVDEDGTYRLRRLAPRLPKTIRMWHVDRNGKLKAVIQYAPVPVSTSYPMAGSGAIRGGVRDLPTATYDVRGMNVNPQVAPTRFATSVSFQYLTIPSEYACVFTLEREGDNYQGHACDPNTPIPTPIGWRRMGDLRVGDHVFDERGVPTEVMATKLWKDRPCYRLTFNDGTSIVADANHQWLTRKVWERTTARNLPGQIHTTSEIAATVRNKRGQANHSIEFAGPLQYARKALPIHPYVFGYWLGDGSATGGELSVHKNDANWLAETVRQCGHEAEIRLGFRTQGDTRTVSVYSLRPVLRELGVYGDKSIPRIYLESSVEDRRALLAGLMDSDGNFHRKLGNCRFHNTNLVLIDGVVELVRSLGGGATKRLSDPVPSERTSAHDPMTDGYMVQFNPTWTPFWLPRKAKVCAAHLVRRKRQRHYIVACEPVERRDTICIETDSPSHLFVSGHGCVASHNSLLRAVYRNFYFKDQAYHLEGVRLDRWGVGIPVAMLEEGHQLTQQDLDALVDVLKAVRANERAFLIAPPHVSFDLLPKTGSVSAGSGAGQWIDHHDAQIARNVLAGFLTMGTDQRGTLGFGARLTDMFVSSLNGVAEGITSELKHQVIKQVCDLNFDMSNRKYPRVTCRDLERVDLTHIVETLATLQQVWITPDDNTEKLLRKLLDLPTLDDADTRKAKSAAAGGAPGATSMPAPAPAGEAPAAPKPVEASTPVTRPVARPGKWVRGNWI